MFSSFEKQYVSISTISTDFPTPKLFLDLLNLLVWAGSFYLPLENLGYEGETRREDSIRSDFELDRCSSGETVDKVEDTSDWHVSKSLVPWYWYVTGQGHQTVDWAHRYLKWTSTQRRLLRLCKCSNLPLTTSSLLYSLNRCSSSPKVSNTILGYS